MSRRIGVIVDGDGDFASLKKRFSDGFRILKTDGPRGHTARSIDIAKRSKKQIGMLRAFQCKRVVVVLDFEQRSSRYEDFIREISDAFQEIPWGLRVDVVVTNRMIENWYLADIVHLSRNKAFIRNGLRQKNYEGTDGKSEIKKCMAQGFAYSETEHGPQMFAVLRFEVARTNSPSFEKFISLVGVL